MLNHIVIMGRLTKDPELRYTQNSTPVASFTLAVDRDFQKDAVDFIDCVAWRKTGEFAGQYFRKGQMVAVTGSLQSRQWTDRDGNKRTSWEVNVEHAYFAESKRREDVPGNARRYEERGTRAVEDAGPYRGGYGNPNVNAFEDMGPGHGAGNPFTDSYQETFGAEDGELPF